MIKNYDFIRIDYTGSCDGKVFDTTSPETAKSAGIFNEKAKYEPVTIIVGKGHLLKGIDEALIGKKEGEEFSIELPPEKAFGKKSSKLIKIIPQKIFQEQKMSPAPGMVLDVDGVSARIISVSGGRVIVDFNHPLSSKELSYTVKIHSILNKDDEKTKALVKLYTGKEPEVEIEEKENKKKIKIISEKIPEKAQEVIEKETKELLKPDEVEFIEEKPSKEEVKNDK